MRIASKPAVDAECRWVASALLSTRAADMGGVARAAAEWVAEDFDDPDTTISDHDGFIDAAVAAAIKEVKP